MITNPKDIPAIEEHINYPNYLEYSELMDEFTHKELCIAYDSLTDCELQETLYEQESPLIVFLVNIDKQEKLYLYFEDASNAIKEYDW